LGVNLGANVPAPWSGPQATAFLNPNGNLVAVVLNQTKHHRDRLSLLLDTLPWGNLTMESHGKPIVFQESIYKWLMNVNDS